ncbi:MAG: LysM peptidoglycan-binding domain-containing protein, partial [Clostridia bacterium]|nr:LysM peptidoglycan-binding domain-containing protein [Clostridia bacterium]
MNNDFMLRGFDASSWNGEIDWEKAAGNFDFVLLRAGFGSAVDSLFKENLHGAKEADMLCGAYLESLAENTSDAQDEGRALLEVLNGEELDFPVGVRCENGFKKDVIVYLCGMLSDVGYTPLIGCTAEQAEIFEDSGYDLWLLDGRQGDSAAVVQYAEDEQIEGASIGVNLDYAYKDFSKGNSQYEDEYFWYTVKPGDTLWTIALKFNTDYEKIAKLNGLGSPYLLDIGQ